MRTLVALAFPLSFATACTLLTGVDGYRTERATPGGDGAVEVDASSEDAGTAGDDGAVVGDDAAPNCFALAVTATVPVKASVGGQDVPVPYGSCVGAGTSVRIDKAQGPGDLSFSACPSAPLRAKRCEFTMPGSDVTIHVQ